jgi:hypothetical protein
MGNRNSQVEAPKLILERLGNEMVNGCTIRMASEDHGRNPTAFSVFGASNMTVNAQRSSMLFVHLTSTPYSPQEVNL